jgi:hypothetical protein
MTDSELARRYRPWFHFDVAEPFSVDGVGYTVFRKTMRSDSFPKRSVIVRSGVECVIEYAVYFDYDIQHLYDLEHVWISVGNDGRVVDAEASFHGRYLKALVLNPMPFHGGTHLNIYSQPGKHAFMPSGELFRLVPDWFECCNIGAGEAGLLAMELFSGRISTSESIDRSVRAYIREKFAFEPTLEFEQRPVSEDLYMPWEYLFEEIPRRVETQLQMILSR